MNTEARVITAWDQLPLVLGTKDMALLLGCETSTLWKQLQARRMRPKPMRWARPYRWYRESVRAEFERGPVTTPRPLARQTAPTRTSADVRAVAAAITRDLAEIA